MQWRPTIESFVKFFLSIWNDLIIVLALVALVSAQKSCHHAYLDDPENINDVYFPHPTDCRFYYQCTAHGKVRMKCQPGEKFCKFPHNIPLTNFNSIRYAFWYWNFTLRTTRWCCMWIRRLQEEILNHQEATLSSVQKKVSKLPLTKLSVLKILH